MIGQTARLHAEEEARRDPEHAPTLLQGKGELTAKERALRPKNATQRNVLLQWMEGGVSLVTGQRVLLR